MHFLRTGSSRWRASGRGDGLDKIETREGRHTNKKAHEPSLGVTTKDVRLAVSLSLTAVFKGHN